MEVDTDFNPENFYMNLEDVMKISNQDEVHDVCQDAATPKPASSRGKKAFSGNLRAKCLWLLCAIMLAVIISLCIKHNMLQSSYKQLEENYDNLTLETKALKRRDEAFLKGWVRFESHWYFVSDSTKTWTESRQDCRTRGADLVIINNKEEQLFISGLRKSLWIGLTDQNVEGWWKWVDDTPLTSGYWRMGEPNNIRFGLIDEDCAQVVAPSFPGEEISSWNDLACSQTLYWICERPGWSPI